MKLRLLAAAVAMTVCFPLHIFADNLVNVFYTPSDENIINPERGMFTHHEFYSDRNEELTLDDLEALRADGMSLIFTVYVMRDFRDKEISSSYLKRISRNLRLIRRAGMKAVLRFCYTYSEADKPWDAPWEITKRHIEQLTPILRDNADVIALLEAGFIGVWGEWYYTDNYIFQPNDQQYGPRRQVLDALLEAMPEDRYVAVRYPVVKLNTFNIQYTDTLSNLTAHRTEPLSRISFHNDCFLATDDDMGTFNCVPEYRQYWLWESRYVPMGGETCALSEYCEVPNAMRDFEAYHWSYLNKDYHQDVLRKWEMENFMDEIHRRLGYRLTALQGNYTEKPRVGEPMHVEIDIENTGWAAPFNHRDVDLVFVGKKGAKGTFRVTLDTDIRKWMPGEVTHLSQDITLPTEMQPGQYEMYLALQDPAPSIHDRPEYAIRLANKGMWKKQGYNHLHTFTLNK